MKVYLDCNSTTPVDGRVLSAMLPFFGADFGNPSSAHSYGVQAARAIEFARTQVASLVNADPKQITFCGSATESINTVIGNVADGLIVSTAVEHAATRESLKRATARDVQSVALPVDEFGRLDLDSLKVALRTGPRLVTAIWANNETGVLFPIETIARMCCSHGVRLHVDAVQAVGKVDIDLARIPIDYLSISSHKIFGPKGIAALIAREPNTLSPLVVGGGQEAGLRAGTENVPAIVGFGAAAELAAAARDVRMRQAARFRDRIEHELLSRLDSAWVNGCSSPRIANTTNIGIGGIDGDVLVGVLDSLGLAASTGSACNSSSLEPSHVISAMTGSREKATQSVRFSVSHLNTDEEIAFAIDAVIAAVDSLR